MTLFDNMDLFQVFNCYRKPEAARGEKVLRTFGDKEHCENYIEQYKESGGDCMKIEPYNSAEWEHPKDYRCCILPLKIPH